MQLLAGATLVAGLAHGEPTSVTSADELFRTGKERLAQKDYAHACPLFADSFRADPATGTLLALALCFEGQGKLSSAYRAYAEVANRSQRESRPDREKAARTKMAALDPQVSWLTLTLLPDARDIEGLVVKRNGTVVSTSSFDRSIPVDSGPQVIEATAPGYQPWRTTFTIGTTQETKTVSIPELTEVEETPPPPPKPVAAGKEEPVKAPAPVDRPTPPETTTATSAFQGAGIATIVAGVAGLGTGSFFALRAMSKNKSSKDGCNGNVCSGQALQDRWDAHDAGNMATIGFVAGGVLTVTGFAMVLLGRPARVLSACAGKACLEVVPAGGAHEFGALVNGSFW